MLMRSRTVSNSQVQPIPFRRKDRTRLRRNQQECRQMCPLRRECTRLRSVIEDTDSTTFGKLIGMTYWARIKFFARDRANSLRSFGFSRRDRLDLVSTPVLTPMKAPRLLQPF